MVTSMPVSGGTRTTPWTLDAVLDATTVIAHVNDATEAQRLALVDAAGVADLGTIPMAANYRLRAAPVLRGDGSRCAAVVSDRDGLMLACAGQALEVSGIAAGARELPIPFVHADDSLTVFTQTYAAFTRVDRTGPGAWREIEQYESSISYPADVVGIAGTPVVCFISAGSRAVIEIGANKIRSEEATQSCKLATDGTTLHVLTDTGYAQLAVSSIAGTQGTFAVAPVAALAEQDVARLVLADGMPIALGMDVLDLVATPLAGGAPRVLATAVEYGSVVGWDATAQAAFLVSSRLDTTGAGPTHPQTVLFEQRCL